MIISVALSVILNALALVVASRFMDVALRVIPALLIVGASQAATSLLQGSDGRVHATALIISLVIHFLGLKMLTGEGLWTLIKLTIVSMILLLLIATALARLF